MPEEMRPITLQNLSDVICLLTESSRGTAVELNVDLLSFMALARYWNFSYENSLICYVDSEPAAIVLNCTHSTTREAYTFYWGTLPKFRKGRVGMRLFEAACEKLRENGFVMLYGISSPDRPARRYRFVQAAIPCELVDLQTDALSLPPADSGFEIRPVSCETISQIPLPSEARVHWCQRPAFLQSIAPFIQPLGAFAGGELQAYAVLLRNAGNTLLIDIRSPEFCPPAATEILRHLTGPEFIPPFVIEHVLHNGPMYNLLTSVGFAVKRQFSWLCRDLTAGRSAPAVFA